MARLKPYAAANRLSYGLLDTMPSPELLAAAARGDLSGPEGVERTARKMLEQPQAREALNEYFSQWLRFDRLLTASKDRRKFPLYTRETARAMTEEARTFFSDLVWNDRNFMTFFTADYGYVTPDLAAIYNVTAPARDFDRVPFPAASQRAGILGQGLFLALTSKPDDSSPTARGLFVREQFLCQHVPDPPPGVNTNLPPVTEAHPQTNRDRMTEHAIEPDLRHLPQTDRPDRFRLREIRRRWRAHGTNCRCSSAPRAAKDGVGGTKTVDLDLNTEGNVAGIPDSRFSSPAELGSVLAKSTQCQAVRREAVLPLHRRPDGYRRGRARCSRRYWTNSRLPSSVSKSL